MESEEFAFVYQDLKLQLKELPSLPLLLKSVEKTTKKLECLNLYSLTDKREFDFQLFEQNIFDEITSILVRVAKLKQSQDGSINMQELLDLEQQIESLKSKKIQSFDMLIKTEEALQFQIESLIDENLISAPRHHDNSIKQIVEDQEQQVEDQSQGLINQEGRVAQLKKQIDLLNSKIMKINRGKGKWFDGDHNDFIKIYNHCKGDASKIIQEGIKLLGMKNIEIMDHLQLYQGYLQLQKEKKLASEEFKSIKMLEEETKTEIAFQNQMVNLEKEKLKSKIKEEENIVKKIKVQEFKKKKAEEHQKLISQATKERENEKKSLRISSQKRKEIQTRNMRLIEEQKQKFKQRNSSKGLNSSKEKPKPSNILTHNNLKPKLPKPSIPLPQSKNSKQ